MPKASYNENCFSIYCNRCSISLKFYLEQFCSLPLAVLGNKLILFALTWFDHDIAHKNTKMCLLYRSFTSSFSLSLSSGLGTRSGSIQNGKVDDQPWPRVNKNTLAKTKSLDQHDVMLSGLARSGRWAFVSKWRLPMPPSLETNFLWWNAL